MPSPTPGRASGPDRRPEPVPNLMGYFSRSGGSGPGWGLGDVVVGWLLAELTGAIFLVVLVSATGTNPNDVPLWMAAVSEIPLWIFLIGVPVMATRIKGDGPVADLGLRLRWYDVPLGIVVGFVGQQLLVGLVYWPIFKLLGHSVDVGEVAQKLSGSAHGVVGEIVFFVLVGLGAPVAEEIFFRGLTQRALLKQSRLARLNPWFAIVVTAAFFALSHFEFVQFPGLFAFGLVLGVLAWKTQRLGAGIWAHLTFNAVVAATLLWHLNLPAFSP